MITIKQIDEDNVELNIDKGTSHKVFLLGIEMLIEALMQDTNFNLTIDDFLEDIRRIYIRDNGDNK